MPEIDIRMVKYELLCYGARCSLDVLNMIRKINPYAGINKSVHSTPFFINNNIFVNVPIRESYTKSSPYIIKSDKKQLILCKGNINVCKLTILSLPNWYEKRTSNNTKMHDVLSIHNKNVLALTHYTNCYYISKGQRCLFCSVECNRNLRLLNLDIRKQDIVETLVEALKENCHYSLALSEGVKNNNDRGAVYFSSILKKISDSGLLIKSSVELAPPINSSYIDLLHSCGASSIIMNMEFFDNKIRKAYCPGKGEISTEQYINALRHSVRIFGSGNVASVLIVGIESIDNTITCAKLLLDMGVLPIIIPFKPYDNCMLNDKKTTNPEELKFIAKNMEQYIKKIEFKNISNVACISCGACNADYYNVLKDDYV